VEELFRERRTIRDFKNQKMDQRQLEEIAAVAIYAPTHDFNLRTIIIDDENIIAMADSLILKFSKRLYSVMYKPKIVYGLLKLFAPGQDFEYRQAIPKLKSAIKRNRGFKSRPAAVILIVGNRRVPLSLASAQYALYNMDLYAQTKGFACRNLVGNQMILNRSRRFRNAIGLKKKEKIQGTLLVGYPAVRFRNKVAGKKMHIQWNAMKN
jgi:nitroreductase